MVTATAMVSVSAKATASAMRCNLQTAPARATGTMMKLDAATAETYGGNREARRNRPHRRSWQAQRRPRTSLQR
jgi:purine nucleoside permease